MKKNLYYFTFAFVFIFANLLRQFPFLIEQLIYKPYTICLCYNPLLSGWYLQQVTDSFLTITISFSPIAVAIAKSVDSYLATSIARLI